jgi:hypothetical protein
VAGGQAFKGRQFASEVILWAVRWSLMFPISYRDLELMLRDRGAAADHTTIFRWIQAYAAELDRRIRPHLRPSNGSWRVDETYIRVKGRWTYLYRAVDSRGQTIDFLLSAKRDAAAAKRFFRTALSESERGNEGKRRAVAISRLRQGRDDGNPEKQLQQPVFRHHTPRWDSQNVAADRFGGSRGHKVELTTDLLIAGEDLLLPRVRPRIFTIPIITLQQNITQQRVIVLVSSMSLSTARGEEPV